jgi:hypothetical protein
MSRADEVAAAYRPLAAAARDRSSEILAPLLAIGAAYDCASIADAVARHGLVPA